MMKAAAPTCNGPGRHSIGPLLCIIAVFFAFPAEEFVTENFFPHQKQESDDDNASDD